MKEFIKDGKIVRTPMDGIDYDLKQLDAAQVHDLNTLVSKQRTGSIFNATDVQRLIQLRRAARQVRRPTAQEKLRASINELREVLK